MTKFLYLATAIAAALSFSSAAFAVTPDQLPVDSIKWGDGTILKPTPVRPPNPRPLAPSRQSIQCEYKYGFLKIVFAIPEGQCLMTVTETTTGDAAQYLFDTASETTVYVGELHQAYIKFSTANSNIYGGVIEL